MEDETLKEKKKSGKGCLILIFSLFVFVGLFTLYLTVPKIY